MFYQFLFPIVILVRANIYSRTVLRITDTLLILGNELFYGVINWGKHDL